MKLMHRFRFVILLGGLWAAGSMLLEAQLQFPGKPIGASDQYKAAEVMYVLPPPDPFEIEAGKAQNFQSHGKVLHYAIERPVDLTPDAHGGWITREQFRVWRIHIVSPGAYSLGLVFNSYNLEPGVKVFIYDPDQEHVKGAFTGGNNKASGILAVGHIPGDELIVEMQVPQGLSRYGDLRVESLSHGFLDLKHITGTEECDPGVVGFGCAQDCEIDVNCPDGDGWELTRRSVVRIFTSVFYCTGVLVNNTSYDGTPYVLTAEHCINKQYYADRSVFLFNYESPACGGGEGPTDMSISGCDSIATGDSLDFSLVKLSVTPPESFDVYYAGWDRSDFQTSGTFAIHHPMGDVKKISSDTEIPSIPLNQFDVPYTDLDDYHYFSFWWIRGWDTGSTEGGSSGGPLFNAGKRVIGVLSGGIASCGDSIGYDEENNRIIYNKAFNYDDYYTRMRLAWDFNGLEGPSLVTWLDPVNSGDITIGGYHPTGTSPPTKAAETQFRVYPNPVSGILRIAGESYHSAPVTFLLIDMAGHVKLSGMLNRDGSGEIDTTPLSPGIYIIRLDDAGIPEYHKIVVTR